MILHYTRDLDKHTHFFQWRRYSPSTSIVCVTASEGVVVDWGGLLLEDTPSICSMGVSVGVSLWEEGGGGDEVEGGNRSRPEWGEWSTNVKIGRKTVS